jgi:putative oxidoreductase
MATTVMTESRTIETVSTANRTWATMLFATTASVPLLILRLGLGIVFLPHGLQKTFGFFGGHGFSGTMDMFTMQMGIPAFFAALAIAAEFLGALGLITGFLTRIAAFGILCNMIVAALFVHLPNGFFMNWGGNQAGEGFEYHILAIVIALSIIVAGAGRFSFDRAIFRKMIGRA